MSRQRLVVTRAVIGRAARPAALVLALVLLPPPRPAPASEDPLAQVQQVLDARVAAARSGDREAFLATVDPQAPEAFRSAQARQFDGLGSLPLASYSLQARLEDSPDLGPGVAARYGGARVFLPETRQSYRLEGYDEVDAVDSLWLTFVERDGRWYVAADRDLEPVGLDTSRNLWDLGPVRVRRTPHLLVLSHPQQAERADALAAIADNALDVLAEVWDQPWPERIPLVLPGSTEELEELLQATIDLDKFVAFVVYGEVRDEGYAATAPRIYIQDENLRRYSRRYQVETLVHELCHAAAAPLSGPAIPSWLHEGVAEWVATGRPLDEERPRGSDGRLPREHEFTTGSQESILEAYREATSAVSWLARERGQGMPTALLRRIGEMRVAPGSREHRVDVALRELTGTPLAELERSWANS